MARPRTFDTDDALARARASSWAGGIRASSVAELDAKRGLEARDAHAVANAALAGLRAARPPP